MKRLRGAFSSGFGYSRGVPKSDVFETDLSAAEALVAMALPKRATSVWTMVTKDKETGQHDKSGTESHSCHDEMHEIEGWDVRDGGPAEQAEKTEERHYAENDGDPRVHTCFAHETASLVAAVWVLAPEGEP
jgi:hypothetical protein